MGNAPDSIKRLIDRFNNQRDQICSVDYNETLIRIDFINPLMTELGWDIENRQGFAEQYREVVHEDRVKCGRPDQGARLLLPNRWNQKVLLEAKKPAVDIKKNWEPYQSLPIQSKRTSIHSHRNPIQPGRDSTHPRLNPVERRPESV